MHYVFVLKLFPFEKSGSCFDKIKGIGFLFDNIDWSLDCRMCMVCVVYLIYLDAIAVAGRDHVGMGNPEFNKMILLPTQI